jgi:hypothetical protein
MKSARITPVRFLARTSALALAVAAAGASAQGNSAIDEMIISRPPRPSRPWRPPQPPYR